MIVGGVVPRLDGFARTLSIAEAWVANSVLSQSLHDMFYYDRWLQTTPPLFLLLVRATVGLFGLSDSSLHAAPLVFSVLALLLLARLAGRMFRPPFALLCISLMALSPLAIVFSKELKPYSADVAASCLILLALWEYLQHGDRRHFVWLLLAFGATLPLSYTAVVFVPLALCVVVWSGPADGSPTGRSLTLARSAILVATTSMISGLNYFFFIKPNTSPLLTGFWQGGYPPLKLGADTVHFFVEHYLAMGIYFYFPEHSAFKDALKSMVFSLPGYIQVIGSVTALMLIPISVKVLRRDRCYRWAAMFFFVPVLTLIALNWARTYPIGSRRLTLFMLPCIVIVTTAIVEGLWHAVFTPLLSPRAQKRILVCASATCVLGVLVLGCHAAGWSMDLNEHTDNESAFRYLQSQIQTDHDTLYVHASVEEPARLYFRMLHWDNAPVLYGHTGWPCCKRTAEARPQDPMQERAYVLKDFDNVIKTRRDGDLWLVFTELAKRWAWVHVDELTIITNRLNEIGCRKELERHFRSDLEVVEKFRCPGPTSAWDSSGRTTWSGPKAKTTD